MKSVGRRVGYRGLQWPCPYARVDATFAQVACRRTTHGPVPTSPPVPRAETTPMAGNAKRSRPQESSRSNCERHRHDHDSIGPVPRWYHQRTSGCKRLVSAVSNRYPRRPATNRSRPAAGGGGSDRVFRSFSSCPDSRQPRDCEQACPIRREPDREGKDTKHRCERDRGFRRVGKRLIGFHEAEFDRLTKASSRRADKAQRIRPQTTELSERTLAGCGGHALHGSVIPWWFGALRSDKKDRLSANAEVMV